jgi:hypothetical protein
MTCLKCVVSSFFEGPAGCEVMADDEGLLQGEGQSGLSERC